LTYDTGFPIAAEIFAAMSAWEKRLGPGDDIGLPLVSGAGERGNRNGRDVASVDHAGPAVAGRCVELALGGDPGRELEEILHEEIGLENGPGEARAPELVLGPRVQPTQLERGVGRGAHRR